MKLFETNNDILREEKAIKLFCNQYNLSYKKLESFDVDFALFNKENKLIGYAEVKGRLKPISKAFPVYIAIRKLLKLQDKKSEAIIIWACNDGIIYAKAKNIKGIIEWRGRDIIREGSSNDIEFMANYENQKEIKFIYY
ncbi:MAG: hypothetical protein EBS55_03855 [Flavobacteriaceae bacterium]|nr:hypothetical protein [Flavobacteriaceae bacterium]